MDLNATTSYVPEIHHFHAVDYVIFVLLLCVSISIGLYYACSGGKQRTATEYLVGNRNMGKLPIAMSLTASFMSSIAMLGMPSEIYAYGIGYYFVILGLILVMPASAFLFLPVFYRLQVTSVNEGGIKAVMWTDVVQVTVMVGALLVLCIKGTIDVGGLSALYEKNVEGRRLEPLSFSFDPTIRYTFWGCSLGVFISWGVVYGVYQPQVQRYLSSPTMKDAQNSIWLNLPGMLLLYTMCCYTGLILYTRYWDCDPVTTKQLQAPDQIIPLFVMESMSSYPGLPGLYVAGVFSGSLSTVSSVFNSVAAVVLEDFVRQTKRWKNITEEQGAKISKATALTFGLMCLLTASLGDFFGSIIQSSSFNINVFSASLYGIFALGLFFPWATSLGVEIGTVCGMAIGMWYSVGTQLSTYNSPRPPTSVHGCSPEILNNRNFTNSSPISQEEVFGLYRLSYIWMSGLVAGTVIISGLIASFLTGANGVNDVDPRLLSCSTKYFMKLIYGKAYKGDAEETINGVVSMEELEVKTPLTAKVTNGEIEGHKIGTGS